MRKAISIVLVGILLFNVLGFYGLFLSLRMKSTQDLLQRLDHNQYSDAETITLKVPVSLPYTSGNDQYERVNGEIEINGEFFHLVKQKLAQDTVYIVCIKDVQGKKITQVLNDYVKTFSDKSTSTKNTDKIFQTIIKDYLPTVLNIEKKDMGWNSTVERYLCYTTFLGSTHAQQVSQPPETIL